MWAQYNHKSPYKRKAKVSRLKKSGGRKVREIIRPWRQREPEPRERWSTLLGLKLEKKATCQGI
jgi:hypothetical protein